MSWWLGVLVALAVAQAGGEASTPFVVPDTLHGLDSCQELWYQLTGDCTPCHTVQQLIDIGRPIPCVA